MKGFRHSIHLALGGALAIVAVSACSSSPPPPPSPPTPSSAEPQTPMSTGGSNAAQPGFEEDHATPGGPPSQGQQGAGAGPQGTGPGVSAAPQPSSQEPQPGSRGPLGGTNEPPAGVNEREACEALTKNATLHIESIEGGVAIVARPRRGQDLATLRQDMHKVERGIEQGAPAPAATQCDLFALARNGVVAIAETPDSIRLLVTTSDAPRVQQLRRQAGEFVRSKGSPTKSPAPPRSAPQRDTHGGETPHPSDETPHPATP
jgi:hypothetical protein